MDFESILNSTENSPPFDFLIRNEGELTFNRLIRTLKAQGDLSKIPNLSFISDQTVIHNPPDGVLDLKRLKLPDRDSRIIKKGFHLFGYPADVIETSRGCTFDCDFCSITNMYGKSFRKFEIDRVIRDIRSLDQRGVKAVMLSDDNPTIHGKRFKSLCQAIIDERLNHMRYYVQAGIRGLKQTPGLPETMVQAGAKWIFLGIENVADSNMQFLDKRDQFSKDEAFEVISHLKALGALVFGGFIIGNPDDTEESILQNYEYAKKLGVDVPVFGILTPLPKTPIRQKLIEQGLVTNPHDYSKYSGFDACVRTKHLSAEALQSLRDRLGYRYPFESGAIWRILRTFPLFFPKMVARELMKRPRDVFSYLRGGPR